MPVGARLRKAAREMKTWHITYTTREHDKICVHTYGRVRCANLAAL